MLASSPGQRSSRLWLGLRLREAVCVASDRQASLRPDDLPRRPGVAEPPSSWQIVLAPSSTPGASAFGVLPSIRLETDRPGAEQPFCDLVTRDHAAAGRVVRADGCTVGRVRYRSQGHSLRTAVRRRPGPLSPTRGAAATVSCHPGHYPSQDCRRQDSRCRAYRRQVSGCPDCCRRSRRQ